MIKMKRTAAKVLLSLIIILTMMPFSFVKADQTLYATISYSTVTWEDDPIDTRLQTGKVLIAISLSNYFTGTIDVNMITDTARASDIVSESTMYSTNGNTVNYTGVYTQSGFYRGETYRVQFINQKEIYLIYEYKCLKTLNSTYGPLEYKPYSYNSINYALSEEGIYFGVTTDLIVLDLNEMLDYLQQQNENYLPAILTMLQTINSNLENNGNSASTISARFTNDYNLNVKETWRNPDGYTQLAKTGNDFTLGNNGITCNRNGFVLILSKVYFNTGSSTGIRVGTQIVKNGSGMDNAFSYSWCVNSVTVPNIVFTQVTEGDVIRIGVVRNGNINAVVEKSTNITMQYIGSSDNQELSGIISALNIIQANQTSSLNNQSQIITLLNELVANTEQQEEITLVNNEINNYNRTINNITNTYNNTITTDFQRLTFTDLINVNPESENNILPAVNLYNNVFEGVINIPDIKSILIFFLLCVLIIAMVG